MTTPLRLPFRLERPTERRIARLKGRIGYYLLTVILLNLTYPLAEGGNTLQAYLYTVVYCIVLGFGVYIVSETLVHVRWAALLAGLTALLSVPWVLFSNAVPLIGTATFLGLFSIHLLVIGVLFRYMLTAPSVTKQTLQAAITIYLLIGDAFIPLYMALELLTRLTTGAPAFMIAATPDVAVGWPQMAYYSFVTLTTTGYGDILPVSTWARSIVVFESVVGTLTIAIVIGRLVGLYSRPTEAADDERS